MTLVEFLLERIAEEERVARSALPLPDGIERVAPVRQDRSRDGWVAFDANGEESLLLAPASPDSPLARPLGDWGMNGGPIDWDDSESRKLLEILGHEPRSGVEVLPYNVLDAGAWDEDEPIGGAYYVAHVPGRCPRGVAHHIATWDPARVLAECAAKRRIVELHRTETEQDWVHELDGPDHQETEYSCAICGWFPAGSACDTIRLLALPYADHPDYREEWRV